MIERKVFDAQPDAILDFAIAPGGKQLAVARFDGARLLLDAATGKTDRSAASDRSPSPRSREASRQPACRFGRTSTSRGDRIEPRLHNERDIVRAADVKVDVDAATRPDTLTLKYRNADRRKRRRRAADIRGRCGQVGPGDARARPLCGDSGDRGNGLGTLAQTVKLPATMVGAIDRAGDADFFRFDAKAGDQIGVQVIAHPSSARSSTRYSS